MHLQDQAFHMPLNLSHPNLKHNWTNSLDRPILHGQLISPCRSFVQASRVKFKEVFCYLPTNSGRCISKGRLLSFTFDRLTNRFRSGVWAVQFQYWLGFNHCRSMFVFASPILQTTRNWGFSEAGSWMYYYWLYKVICPHSFSIRIMMQ